MVRGTRILMNDEAEQFINMQNTIRSFLKQNEYKEIIIPSICNLDIFEEKIKNSNVV